MSGELGCAREYKVELVFVQVQNANGQALAAPVQWGGEELRGVARVQWGRVANDVSEAVVTVSGAPDGAMCCSQIEKILPHAYELRIWRDGELVWEGPISQDVETSLGGDYVITARDVIDWLEGENGRPNLFNLNYPGSDPVTIARDILVRNLTDTWAVPNDYPMVLDYLYTSLAGETIAWAPGLVVERIMDLWEELTDYGLNFTTLGRSIYLTGRADTTTPVMAQLTQEDTNSPIVVTQDGEELGNVGIAVRPNADSDLPPTLFIQGSPNSIYRPAYRVVDVDKAVGTTTARRAAQRAIAGRTVPPLIVTMDGNAQLYPTAPIQINEIICGWTRIDFVAAGRGTEGLCKPVQQAMTCASMNVEWVPGLEKVQVALVPLGAPVVITEEA